MQNVKHVIFEPGKKLLFLDIPSTDTDILAPSLYPVRRNPQHRSLLTVVSANSAPQFHHLRISNVFEEISLPTCEPLHTIHTFYRKQERFIYDYPLQ
jgi:hypothetical protein